MLCPRHTSSEPLTVPRGHCTRSSSSLQHAQNAHAWQGCRGLCPHQKEKRLSAARLRGAWELESRQVPRSQAHSLALQREGCTSLLQQHPSNKAQAIARPIYSQTDCQIRLHKSKVWQSRLPAAPVEAQGAMFLSNAPQVGAPNVLCSAIPHTRASVVGCCCSRLSSQDLPLSVLADNCIAVESIRARHRTPACGHSSERQVYARQVGSPSCAGLIIKPITQATGRHT